MRLTSTSSSSVCLCLLFLCVDNAAAYLSLSSFSTTTTTMRSFSSTVVRRRCWLVANKNDNNDDDDDTNTSHPVPLEEWLDQPFFDPTEFAEDDTSLVGKFAQLCKTNYNLAEILYAGCFIAFMMILSQEMFRFQIHGHDIVVWN